jgi:plasmid stability protein
VNDLKIRKLPDWVVDTWRFRAKTTGRSLEEELRVLLTEQALECQHQFGSEAAALSEKLREKYGTMPDSTSGIVQDRQRRG